jgi:succinyl-CoA synthetase beta subunit
MKALEFEAKRLCSLAGLPVPAGEVVDSPEAARFAAQKAGCPVVVKAQVPSGGRLKAGGIKFAASPQAAASLTGQILGNEIKNLPTKQVLIEKHLEISREIFISATYDNAEGAALLLASTKGGIDVEKSVISVQQIFSILEPVPDYLGRLVAWKLGFTEQAINQLGGIITNVIRCFLKWDAVLLEINPLALDVNGAWWIADVHLELDDEAAFRQQAILPLFPESKAFADRLSEFEKRAAEIDRADHRGVAGRLVAFDGDLGLLIGGGGASLTLFDAVLESGLRPANYCEIGGNPSVWKIKELTKLILGQPNVKKLAVMMNVVSNTRVDLVARGVIKGVLELGCEPKDKIVAFRIPGSWEAEGQAILEHYGIPYFDRGTSLDQVVEEIKWRF